MRRWPKLATLALAALVTGAGPAWAGPAPEPDAAHTVPVVDEGYQQAIGLARAGRTDEALAVFDALLEAAPENADYLLGRGLTLLWAGRPADAVAPLERAVALAPDYADARQALATAHTAAAGEAPEAAPDPERQVWVALRREQLDRGLDPWSAARVGWSRSTPGRWRVAAAAFTEQRFGQRDAGAAVEAAVPLGPALTLDGALATAPGARVIPRLDVGMGLHRAWPGGWGGSARMGYRRFSDTGVSSLGLGSERYLGDWRLAYTLGLTDVSGVSGVLRSHAIGVDRFLAGGHRLGLRISSGREDTVVGTGVVAARVRSAALVGRHPLPGSGWALGWELGHVRQGAFHDRAVFGIRLEHAY